VRRLIIVGVVPDPVPQVPEQQAADSQPPASETSSSPMDVDSPTPGIAHF